MKYQRPILLAVTVGMLFVLAYGLGDKTISDNTKHNKNSFDTYYMETCKDPLEKCTKEIKDVNNPDITLIEFFIADLHFQIPKQYISFPTSQRVKPSRLGTSLRVKFPPFILLEYVDWHTNNNSSEQVSIRFSMHKNTPVAVTAEKLEKIIIKRHGAPTKLKNIPSLQEYPSGYMGRKPHYRTTDNSMRFADGLPTYMYCTSTSITTGNNITPTNNVSERTSMCTIEMTWPNGFLVNVSFNKKYLDQWKEIHDKSIQLLKSFEVNHQLPIGTLALD